MKIYKIIPPFAVPDDPKWQLVAENPDSMDVENISRHITKEDAENAKAECERRDMESSRGRDR
jgi:hypothetical protein